MSTKTSEMLPFLWIFLNNSPYSVASLIESQCKKRRESFWQEPQTDGPSKTKQTRRTPVNNSACLLFHSLPFKKQQYYISNSHKTKKMDFQQQISIKYLDSEKIEFVLSNVDISIANSLRRFKFWSYFCLIFSKYSQNKNNQDYDWRSSNNGYWTCWNSQK